MQPVGTNYYYFWTGLRVSEPHVNNKTARGIILEINLENSANQQINFTVQGKKPGFGKKIHILWPNFL